MSSKLRGNYQKGAPISYNELLSLPDNSVVWFWAKRRDRGVWSNDPIQIERLADYSGWGKKYKCWGFTWQPDEYPIEKTPIHDANSCLMPDYELLSKRDEPILWMDDYSDFKLFHAIPKIKKKIKKEKK